MGQHFGLDSRPSFSFRLGYVSGGVSSVGRRQDDRVKRRLKQTTARISGGTRAEMGHLPSSAWRQAEQYEPDYLYFPLSLSCSAGWLPVKTRISRWRSLMTRGTRQAAASRQGVPLPLHDLRLNYELVYFLRFTWDMTLLFKRHFGKGLSFSISPPTLRGISFVFRHSHLFFPIRTVLP